MRRKRIAAGMIVLAVLMVAGAAIGFALFFGKQTATSAAGAPTKAIQAASPLQPVMYLEGTIESGVTCGCVFLQTVYFGKYELWGDLEGFTCGDRVGVWGTLCPDCVSICMEGEGIFLVQDIVGLASNCGDVDCDDDVDAVDALFVLQHVVGLRDELGCPDLQVVKEGSIRPGTIHPEVRP
jgi:hypothetical protein